jgi:hypothetical protein
VDVGTGFGIFSKIFSKVIRRGSENTQAQTLYNYDRWRFRISNSIVQNLKVFEDRIIVQANFEFIWQIKDITWTVKKGINCFGKNEKGKHPGGGWVVIVKFHKSKFKEVLGTHSYGLSGV